MTLSITCLTNSKHQRSYLDTTYQITQKEAMLLKLFCDYPNRLIRRDEALKLIWEKNDQFNRKTMDVFIFKLRRYLKADDQVQIINVHRKGFILQTG